MALRNVGLGSHAPSRAPETARMIWYQLAKRPMADAKAAPLMATAPCTVTSRWSRTGECSSRVAVSTHPTSGPPTQSALMVKETALRPGGVRSSPVRLAAGAKRSAGRGGADLAVRAYFDRGVCSRGWYGTATSSGFDSSPVSVLGPGTATVLVANADARRRR